MEAPWLSYGGAVVLGLLHGSDPGHGWPVAALRARGSGGGMGRLLLYVGILSVGHYASTLLVVGLVWLLGRAASGFLWLLQAGAGVLLVALGARLLYALLRGGGGGHDHGLSPEAGALEMARYAALLGLAHEEEVALAAIVLLGADPLLLSIAYGASVAVAMTLWGLAAYAALGLAKERLGDKLEPLLDAGSGLLLLAIGIYTLASALSTG